MNMKKVWCILVLAVVLVLLPVKGYSLITSRIQGRVLDNKTGEPVNGAKVRLLYSSNYSPLYIIQQGMNTGSKGFFKFDLLNKGYYYLCIHKDGYADFGPFFEAEFDKNKIHRGPTWPTYFHLLTPHLYENTKINLKEGEIKHVEIKLKKEAIIDIRFIRKTMAGIEPVNKEIFPGYFDKKLFNCSVDIDFIDVPGAGIYADYSEKSLGRMVFKGLPGGYRVNVRVDAEGYPEKYHKFTLEEGKTHLIEHLLDYTTGQVVYGIITDKTTGKPLNGVDIYLFSIDERKDHGSFQTDSSGKYWLGGFIPGKYIMNIFLPNSDEIVKISLVVEENQKIEINRQF